MRSQRRREDCVAVGRVWTCRVHLNQFFSIFEPLFLGDSNAPLVLLMRTEQGEAGTVPGTGEGLPAAGSREAHSEMGS